MLNFLKRLFRKRSDAVSSSSDVNLSIITSSNGVQAANQDGKSGGGGSNYGWDDSGDSGDGGGGDGGGGDGGGGD